MSKIYVSFVSFSPIISSSWIFAKLRALGNPTAAGRMTRLQWKKNLRRIESCYKVVACKQTLSIKKLIMAGKREGIVSCMCIMWRTKTRLASFYANYADAPAPFFRANAVLMRVSETMLGRVMKLFSINTSFVSHRGRRTANSSGAVPVSLGISQAAKFLSLQDSAIFILLQHCRIDVTHCSEGNIEIFVFSTNSIHSSTLTV